MLLNFKLDGQRENNMLIRSQSAIPLTVSQFLKLACVHESGGPAIHCKQSVTWHATAGTLINRHTARLRSNGLATAGMSLLSSIVRSLPGTDDETFRRHQHANSQIAVKTTSQHKCKAASEAISRPTIQSQWLCNYRPMPLIH